MFEIFIIKVEDPSCFWGRITNGFSDLVENANQYQRLEEKMNQLYNRNHEDLEEIKLPVLEQGQICAIYCHELRCWCRAILESLVSSGNSYLAECFLVDYAKHILVKAKDVRRAVDAFWKLPYRAKKFTLFGIQPLTLHVDVCEEKAKIGPAVRWDSAAIQYFQKMSLESEVAEAKLQGVTGDTFAIQLYLSLNDEKVCLNDDLVAKFFASYVSPKDMVKNPNSASAISSALHQKKEVPVKKNVDHAALALWSETVQGIALTVLKQGPADQEPVAQSLQSQESVSSKSMNRQYSETAVLSSNRKSTESLATFSLCSLEKELDCKRARFYLHDEMGMDRESFTVMEECDEIPAARSYELWKKKIVSPNVAQAYCWPAIGRGCDLIAISQKGDDPFLYLPPLLTFLQLPSVYSYQPRRNLPLAIIVCPGRQKAHFVCQKLMDLTRTSRPLSLSLVLVGQDPEETKKTKFTKGCDVVVTTPHSLVRVLQIHCLFFIRLSHLVLDRVDVLFDEAMDEMNTILQCFREATHVPERGSTPQQLIAVGQHWSKKMDTLLKESQSDPYVVITVMEEAALYGNVHQIVKVCLDSEKTSFLITMLDFTSEVLQKTIIFANCAEEVDHVFKALGSNSHFCMKVHERMSLQVSNTMDEWSKKFNPGTHVILVTTDNCVKALRITDATCVIHYGFPSSCEIFGTRLYCMVDSFDNLTMEGSTRQGQSIVLLTEKDVLQTVSILHYLERTEAKIPKELFKFILNMNNPDDICYDRALCKYLKAYGICRDNKTCPSRHKLHHDVDKPRYLTAEKILPATGYIEIIPTCVSDASSCYGRIIHHRNKWEDTPVSMEEDYLMLLKAMADYYLEDDHRKSVEQLEVSALYGLEEKSYSRVRLIALPKEAESAVLRNARVKYIDSGHTGLVMQKQLLKLPAKFQVLPPQVVEFIVCRVKPIDNEMDWNPQVSRYIKQKISNKSHEAKIVLALGNTLWLNPVVRTATLADLKTTILEYNVRSQIMNSGFGTDNAEHIERLKDLCRVAGLSLPNEHSPLKQLHYDNKLDHVTLENDGNYHSVVITEFYSPKKFHVQLLATREAFYAFENEINEKIMEKEMISNSYVPTVGGLCLAFCETEKRWRRVKILSVVDPKRIYEVFFVDFGTCSYISWNNIHPLMKDALRLPFQKEDIRPLKNEAGELIMENKEMMEEPNGYLTSVFTMKMPGAYQHSKRVRDQCECSDLYEGEGAREAERSEVEESPGPCGLHARVLQGIVEPIVETLAICCSLFGVEPVGKFCNPEIKQWSWSTFQDKELQVKVIEQSRNELTDAICYHVVVQDPSNAGSIKLSESSALRTTIVEELKNIVLQYPAESASDSGLHSLCWLLRFLSVPKEQTDVIIAMTHLARMQGRDLDEIKQETGIYALVKLLQGVTSAELQESICVALGILGENADLRTAIIDANALKHLCHLLKMPIETNVWEATIGALASLLCSNRQLVHTSSKTASYKVANNLKFSLASLQNLHCPQNDAACCEGNTGIMDLPEDRQNKLTVDPKSFNPEIKWHQKEDRLILNIKLQNFTEHSCKFDHCRVIFSASVGTKLYLADLELKGSILKEKSSCVIKNEEPVIILFKEEKGEWSSLLKFKNPNVTFDFNYLEEVTDDVSLPIWNDIRRNRKPVVMEPIINEYDSFTSANDSSEEDY
ncbi:putative ATP-dependent RNA helicase TDRD12 [Stegostoma tigrinum]|uniref:putative ATP-dependent RNA helicase TDRD12 n=1 Tax=Stegostoma tigrinum TaxID=3053191 RepID=UPI002870146E|nr:putative ATP-dependent RNA helicase TDRD12 [Stegostoma tigrinum]